MLPELTCLSALIARLLLPSSHEQQSEGFVLDSVGGAIPSSCSGVERLPFRSLRGLLNQPFLGLRPASVVSDNIADKEIDGVHVFKSECLDQIASSGVGHAIVAAPELSQSEFA